MAANNVLRLIEIASEPIGSGFDREDFPQSLNPHVKDLLSERDGFYAFEGALLVRPMHDTSDVLGLISWNSFDLWKSEYVDIHVELQRYTFFAENIFGEQFFLADSSVGQFDPETGENHKIADSLDSWAGKLLRDCNYLTGHGIAHEWQERRGRLANGMRLIPKIPFILQGEFDVSNLVAKPELDAIIIRSQLASKLSGLKNGETINFAITD